MYLKINNAIPPKGGMVDYKGLNIDNFVPLSQIYLDDGTAYVETTDTEIPVHTDLTVLTDIEYQNAKTQNPEKVPDPMIDLNKQIETIKSLQTENADLKERLAYAESAIDFLVMQ